MRFLGVLGRERQEEAGRFNSFVIFHHDSVCYGTTVCVAAQLRVLRHDSVCCGVLVCVSQPAEEGGAGAKAMVEEGALLSPDVDEVYGLHLYNYHKLGYVGVKHGPIMAAACRYGCCPRPVSCPPPETPAGCPSVTLAHGAPPPPASRRYKIEIVGKGAD